jgi:adenosylmethionine-8-amino-7-oxononanoate aminotransferase
MANIFGIRIPSIKQQRCQLPLKGKALLWDENNKEYIDAIASWWVNPYGHSIHIADAIYKQLTTLEHVLFGGLHTSLQLSSRS